MTMHLNLFPALLRLLLHFARIQLSSFSLGGAEWLLYLFFCPSGAEETDPTP